jgi:S-adenosylmethionine-dependent methyltransferase
MSITSQSFDGKASTWKSEQLTPWARLRRNQSHFNLSRHIETSQSLHILDAGGGDGNDAIRLAEQGHTVTLLDFSEEMLEEAGRTAEIRGISEKITFQQADVIEVGELFPKPEFDVILCHNVVPYVDDIETLLIALWQSLLPTGILSLVGVNRYSEVYRQALQQVDLTAAREAIGTTSTTSKLFDLPIRLYAAEDLLPVLEENGYEVLGVYGLVGVCGYIQNNDLKYEPEFFAQLEALENAVSDQYPYNLVARFYQIIVRKV